MIKYQSNNLTGTLMAIAFTFIAGTTLMFGALSPAHVQTAQTAVTVSAA